MVDDEDPRPWPLGPHPGGQAAVDARSLRGLAHPLRVRLLGLLRADGPSTASKLAERLRLTSGATSYHLRQLATYGFIVEHEVDGGGRERWWRAAHQSTRVEPELLAADSEVTEAFLRSLATIYSDQLDRAVSEWVTLPEQWRRAQALSDFSLRLTPDELTRFTQEARELVARYRTDTGEDGPEGSAPVTVQLHTFRSPGSAGQ